jgi:hypothetical protein
VLLLAHLATSPVPLCLGFAVILES